MMVTMAMAETATAKATETATATVVAMLLPPLLTATMLMTTMVAFKDGNWTMVIG
jgi:hypothetical protein